MASKAGRGNPALHLLEIVLYFDRVHAFRRRASGEEATKVGFIRVAVAVAAPYTASFPTLRLTCHVQEQIGRDVAG